MVAYQRAALLLLIAASGSLLPLFGQNNGGAPGDAAAEFILKAEDPGTCDFDVGFVAQGKFKVLQVGDRKTITVGPGQSATLTNLEDPSRSVTLNITGSFHVTELADGSLVFVVKGRNLLWGGTLPKLTLAIGDFTFTLNPDFSEKEPLEGKGQKIDVCAMID
jgi:hypothetical protein